ncbi:hypothetical protein C0J52_24901, partial [Blattella germanica]
DLCGVSTDSSECSKLTRSSNNNEPKSEDWNVPKLNSGGKVILRKARLKLGSQTTTGTEGPFSVNFSGSGNSSLPGTVVCGVCGAVRFYRFVKQARKFGVYSCESCRKFISKMMKRQSFSKGGSMPVLECHKGAGMCSVPPIVRSQQWRPGRGTQLRCSYKARCPACWLKMCLRSFNMPDTLREKMSLMLPPDMRKSVKKNLCARVDNKSGSVQLKPKGLGKNHLSTHVDKPDGTENKPKELDETPHVPTSDESGLKSDHSANAIAEKGSAFNTGIRVQRKSAINSLKQLRKRNKQKDRDKNHGDRSKRDKRVHSIRLLKKATKKLGKSKDNPDSTLERLRKKKNSGIKVRKKSGQKSDSSLPEKDGMQCQKIDSNFGRLRKKKNSGIKVRKKNGQKSDSSMSGSDGTRRQKLDLKGPRVKHVCRSASIVLGQPQATFPLDKKVEKVQTKSVQVPNSPANKVQDTERNSQNNGETQKVAKPAPNDVESSDNSTNQKCQPSIDSAMNKQDEEPASVPSNCRRSNKTSTLSSTNPAVSTTSVLAAQPSMRTLPVFGKRVAQDPQNLVSIDFWESYDPEEVCNTGFGLIGSESFHVRAMCFLCGSAGTEKVCSSCLRCKSCGAADVTVFVGNLPLCKGCFKLRQKGNYCPLCQRCYEDDDFDTKMMECGQCRCWVHAKCEGLSDEKYQVLSYLPESVEFICRMCCVIPPAPWWLAVEEELKAGYLSVLKSLSKNRKACAMLKWSPKKQCLCRPTLLAKRLDFQEISYKDTETDDQSDFAREDGKIVDIPKKEDQKVGTQISEIELTSVMVPIQSPTVAASIQPPTVTASIQPPTVTASIQPPTVTASIQPPTVTASILPLEANITSAEKSPPKSETDEQSASQMQLPNSNNFVSMTVPQVDHQSILNTENSFPGSFIELSRQEKSITSNVETKAVQQLKEKYNLRDCSVRIENCIPKSSSKLPLTVKIEDNDTGFSPDSTLSECSSKSPPKLQSTSMATPASDSGIGSTDDELKSNCIEEEQEDTKDEVMEVTERLSPSVQSSQLLDFAFRDNRNTGNSASIDKCTKIVCDVTENVNCESTKECYCLDQHTLAKPSPTLLSIKKKVNCNEYSSLLQFHQEMEHLVVRAQCPDLLEMYHHTLKEIFPWFDPKYARVSNNWKETKLGHEETSASISVQVDHVRSHEDELHAEQRNAVGITSITKESRNVPSNFAVGQNIDYYYSGFTVKDLRTCTLCKGLGDGLPVEEGRLLYCGQNEWVHANCALWSAEVFEEIDGSLQNVHSAVSRGRMIRCRICGKKGASVGCCARNCNETFHFPCARRIGCAFMDDKTVFCGTHLHEVDGKPLHLDIEFDIRRPIYVELDRKKKKYAEPHHVKFMIGSLLVENLGEFVPASDNSDIILPVDFQCTRLYWSSVEPWKIVRYFVKTIVRTAEPLSYLDLGRNLTVDHTQEQMLVKQKLDEVSRWHQQLALNHHKFAGKKISENLETVKSKTIQAIEARSVEQSLKRKYKKSIDEKVVRQVMDHLLDAVCSKDVDDSCLSDPQTTADLLPPEVKDAIFEDLPHDLLDGISMQDIFPKLMSYEDLAAMDLKNEACFGTDVHKDEKEDTSEDGILENEVEQVSSYEQLLKSRKHDHTVPELGSQTLFHQCSDSKTQVQEYVEDLFQNVHLKGGSVQKSRELKRSKSEVIPQPNKKLVSGRSHQRSCSLTWSCKLDGTLPSSAKRRKGMRTVPWASGEGSSSLVMVLDSEKAHMLQELRLPDGVLVALARSGTSSGMSDSMRELRYRLEEDAASNETSSVARRKAIHQKEEGKENKYLLWHSHSQPLIVQLDGAADTSSSSGSEGGSPPREVDDDMDDFNPTALNPTLTKRTYCDEEPVRCDRCHRTYRTRSSFERHLPTCSNDFILSTSESDSENTRSSEEEGSKMSKFPSENCHSIRSPSSKKESEQEKDHSVSTKNKSHISSITSSDSVSIQSHPKTVQPPIRTYSVNGRQRGRPSSRMISQRSSTKKENTTPVMNVSPQTQQSSHSVPCHQPATPAVIMQQVPSPNMVPAFVEAFQQQTGQSLQYIATIDAHNNSFSKAHYLATAPNSLVPGAFQLQTPDSYVGLPNGGISMLPGVQLAPPQPAVIGTLIHQTPPATIQCVAAEQVVLGSSPAIEMFTDQTGGMYLTSQPMYYGLETIVSNTVMSSSQFVSAAMPGMMAASSSFSATTTQVFQASKLVEPIVDVPSSFVIMNPHTTQLTSESGLPRTDMIACPSSSLPVNIASPAASQQPQPPVIPQTQTSPMQSVPWSYPESFIAPSNEDHLQPNALQSVTVTSSPHIPTSSSTPPSLPTVQKPPSPCPTVTPSLPQQAPSRLQTALTSFSPMSRPTPTVERPQAASPIVPLKTQANVEIITVNVPASTHASPLVQNPSLVSCTKTLKTSTKMEFPVRTINRVFPLKVNSTLEIPRAGSKLNKEGNEHGTNNRTITGSENRVTIIPIAPNNNNKVSRSNNNNNNQNISNNNSNNKQQNPLKLVFQKQAQDGYYKISNKNHNMKLTDSTRTSTVANQTGSLKSVKIKPCMVTVNEKKKDGHTVTDSKMQNGTSPGHFQNGKVPPLQDKKVLGCNTGPTITYEVHSQDGFSCTSSSITEVWQKVFEAVQEARVLHKMPRLPENPFGASGLQMLGFRHNALRYLVEQLPGVGRCIKYKPRYHKLRPPCPEEDVDALPLENPSGCARCEPFKKRSEYDMFSWLASRHRKPPKFLVSAESESTSNRHLKETSKEAVGVYRSNIHGRGLFCLRDIEAGEMVIEYAGEVIRSMLTDKREKYYESKDIGCYMFRIDDQLVVDATMRGNAARFINHSCEPNCYSRVVDILGKKHILIFALRRIPQGEELTYDYKFPFEDVKIPCTCGSRKCRKYLN